LAKENKRFVCVAFYLKSKSTFAHQQDFCLGVFSLEEKMCIGSANREKLLLCWGHDVCLLGSVVVIIAVPSKSQASGALVFS